MIGDPPVPAEQPNEDIRQSVLRLQQNKHLKSTNYCLLIPWDNLRLGLNLVFISLDTFYRSLLEARKKTVGDPDQITVSQHSKSEG